MKLFNLMMTLFFAVGAIAVVSITALEDQNTFAGGLIFGALLLLSAVFFAWETYLFWTCTEVFDEGTILSVSAVPAMIHPISGVSSVGAITTSPFVTLTVLEYPDEVFTYPGYFFKKPGEKVKLRLFVRKGRLIHTEVLG